MKKALTFVMGAIAVPFIVIIFTVSLVFNLFRYILPRKPVQPGKEEDLAQSLGDQMLNDLADQHARRKR